MYYSKRITGLCVTAYGNVLISGSADATVRVWDIASQQTIKLIPLKGLYSKYFSFYTCVLKLKCYIHTYNISKCQTFLLNLYIAAFEALNFLHVISNLSIIDIVTVYTYICMYMVWLFSSC